LELKEFFVLTFVDIFTNVLDFASNTMNSVSQVYIKFVEILRDCMPNILSFTTTAIEEFGTIVNSVILVAQTVVDNLVVVFSKYLDIIDDFLPEILELNEFLVLTFSDAFTNFLGFASDTISSASQVYIKFVEILSACIPNVLSFSRSVVEVFGEIANSVIEVAKTIAENLIGGVSEYLDVNKDFIQKKIGGIFDASAEATSSFGRLFSAFSSMFSKTFGGERAKKLSADILKIFLN
jgi:phage-related protein